MQNKKIFVLFVEPMLYGLDLIREVYEKTGFIMQYYYCHVGLTGRDTLTLPEGAIVGKGEKGERKRTLHRLLDEFQPDFCVINGYTGDDQTIAIRYCIKHKIPYGIDSDTPLHVPANPVKATLKKWYLHSLFHPKFCYGIAGGTLQKENFLYYGIPEERIFLSYMSVSGGRIREALDTFPCKTQLKKQMGIAGKTTFLFVGRLEEVKSVALLIQAFSRLKKEREEVALLIVGDGSLRASLEGLTQTLCVSDVYFEGYSVFPDLIKYFKAADVFVLPSQFEPWGLVVNEAMFCGLPVLVSSKVGCRKDLVLEGKNGYEFESENEQSLLDGMEKLLEEDLACMGKESLQKINEWGFPAFLPVFQSKMEEV